MSDMGCNISQAAVFWLRLVKVTKEKGTNYTK